MIGTYTIEILGYYAFSAAAHREECRLIRELQPACNIRGTGQVMRDPYHAEGHIERDPLLTRERLRQQQAQQTLQSLTEERGQLLTRVDELEEHVQRLQGDVLRLEAEVLGEQRQVDWLEMQVLRLEAKVCQCVRPRLWHCWKRLRSWRKQ
jgi:hypothetical protein